jgi:hypothetical protein
MRAALRWRGWRRLRILARRRSGRRRTIPLAGFREPLLRFGETRRLPLPFLREALLCFGCTSCRVSQFCQRYLPLHFDGRGLEPFWQAVLHRACVCLSCKPRHGIYAGPWRSRAAQTAMQAAWQVARACVYAHFGPPELPPDPPPDVATPADVMRFLRGHTQHRLELMQMPKTFQEYVQAGTRGPACNMFALSRRIPPTVDPVRPPVETAAYRVTQLLLQREDGTPRCARGDQCAVYRVSDAETHVAYARSEPPLPVHVPPALELHARQVPPVAPVVAHGLCLLCESLQLPLHTRDAAFTAPWHNLPSEYVDTRPLGHGLFYAAPLLERMVVRRHARLGCKYVDESALYFRPGHRERGTRDAPTEISVGRLVASVAEAERVPFDVARMCDSVARCMLLGRAKTVEELLEWRLRHLQHMLLAHNHREFHTAEWAIDAWYEMNAAALQAARAATGTDITAMYGVHGMAPDVQPPPLDPLPAYRRRVVHDLVNGTTNTGGAAMLRSIAAGVPARAPADMHDVLRAALRRLPMHRGASVREFENLEQRLAEMHAVSRSAQNRSLRADSLLAAGLLLRERDFELEAAFEDFDTAFRAPILRVAPTTLLTPAAAKHFHAALDANVRPRLTPRARDTVPAAATDDPRPALLAWRRYATVTELSPLMRLRESDTVLAAWRRNRAVRITRRTQSLPPAASLPPPAHTMLPLCLVCTRVLGDAAKNVMPDTGPQPLCSGCLWDTVCLVDLVFWHVSTPETAPRMYTVCDACGAPHLSEHVRCAACRAAATVDATPACVVGQHALPRTHNLAPDNFATHTADGAPVYVCGRHAAAFPELCVAGMPQNLFTRGARK